MGKIYLELIIYFFVLQLHSWLRGNRLTVQKRYCEFVTDEEIIHSYIIRMCLWKETMLKQSSVLAAGAVSKAADVCLIDGVQE